MPTRTVYRLEIAPLTPLPLTKAPFFSYRSDTPLPVGSLVQAPFGRQSLRGIVYACARLPGRPPLWMKPIERVIASGWLDAGQRALAQHISETYFSSLGNTLKHFVFPLPKRGEPDIGEAPQLRARRSQKVKETAHEFMTDATLGTWLSELAETHAAKQRRALIIMPDLLQVTLWEGRWRPWLGDRLAVITSRLTPKQQATAWGRIRSGEASIILGTRQALFAPLGRLATLVVCSPEESLSYKQWDMTPYYEVTVLARFIAETSGAKLHWVSTSLGLRERMHFPTVTTRETLQGEIINRREDGKGARSKAVGKVLTARIKETLPHGPILLIAKERGVTGILVCQSCRATARCPQCEHLLGEAEAGHLRCLACGYASDIFPRCRACGGMHFQGYGHGTVRVAREVERLFPRARLLRVDRDQLATRADWNQVVKALQAGRFDILITTPEIGSLLPLPPLALAALLESDQLLAMGHYENEERLLLLMERLSGKLSPHGVLCAQTFAPEERIWQAIIQQTLPAYWESLKEERLLLGYPPAAAMIQVAPARDARLTREDFARLRDRLQALVADTDAKITPLFERTLAHRKATPCFLIKHPASTVLPQSVTDWLRKESRHLRIDVHPYRM